MAVEWEAEVQPHEGKGDTQTAGGNLHECSMGPAAARWGGEAILLNHHEDEEGEQGKARVREADNRWGDGRTHRRWGTGGPLLASRQRLSLDWRVEEGHRKANHLRVQNLEEGV